MLQVSQSIFALTVCRSGHTSCQSDHESCLHASAGLGMVNKLGPKTGGRVKEGQRVVAVPWPTAGGEGMYQQYVAVPEKDLVSMHPCNCSTSNM